MSNLTSAAFETDHGGSIEIITLNILFFHNDYILEYQRKICFSKYAL